VKKQFIIIAFISILLVFSFAHASQSWGISTISYERYEFSGNEIQNFSVNVDGRSVTVFNQIVIPGKIPVNSHNPSLYFGNSSMTPFAWTGTGRISMLSAINVSPIGNFVTDLQNFSYLYLYSGNYIGMLISNAQMSENGMNITVSSPDHLQEISVVFLTLPVSTYSVSGSAYSVEGDEYNGSYSSFTSSPSGIANYSIKNQESSVNIFSFIGNRQEIMPSPLSNISGFAATRNISIFPEDDVSPLLFISSIALSVNISLYSEFSFHYSGKTSMWGGSPNSQGISEMIKSIFSEKIYTIMYGNSSIGYVDVFGNASTTGSEMDVNSPLSFVLVRFVPVNDVPDYSVLNHAELVNISAELFVGNGQYFIPFSPNITSQSIGFSNGSITLVYTQVGENNILITIEGSYNIKSLVIYGTNGSKNSSVYSVLRGENQTIVYLTVNGNGTQELSLSISPSAPNHRFPLLLIFLGVSIGLIVSAVSLILYARKKSIYSLEKE